MLQRTIEWNPHIRDEQHVMTCSIQLSLFCELICKLYYCVTSTTQCLLVRPHTVSIDKSLNVK